MDITDIITKHYSLKDFIEMIGDRFPLFHKMEETPQDTVWHAEGNVYIHTDMVLSQAYDLIAGPASYLSDEKKFCLIISALFHDIAKPITTRETERHNRICIISPRHEYMGMSYLAHKLLGLSIDTRLAECILGLVGYHQRPKMLVVKDGNEWDYKSLSQRADMELLYWLEVADMKGRIGDDLDTQLEYLELFKLYAQEYGCFDKKAVITISDNAYIQHKGVTALFNHEIWMPEEALQKFYAHANNHSHFVVLCGLSGVGKSSHIKEHYKDYLIISLDEIRSQLNIREDQSRNAEAVRIAFERLKVAFAQKQDVVYDATNVRRDFRDKVITLAHNYHALSEINYLASDLSTILRQDKEREFSVGQKVISYQDDRFEYPELLESNIHKIYYK